MCYYEDKKNNAVHICIITLTEVQVLSCKSCHGYVLVNKIGGCEDHQITDVEVKKIK